LLAKAKGGDADAQLLLAGIYVKGLGVPQNFEKGAAWALMAAKQGNADAQFELGLRYALGQGVPQNFATAAGWYRKAAEQGYADAQSILSGLYIRGEGVPQDFAEAAAWCRKAAEQGIAVAQLNLGELYIRGIGVPQDFAQAAGESGDMIPIPCYIQPHGTTCKDRCGGTRSSRDAACVIDASQSSSQRAIRRSISLCCASRQSGDTIPTHLLIC